MDSSRRVARLGVLVLAVVAAAGLWLAPGAGAPRPRAACSCAVPTPTRRTARATHTSAPSTLSPSTRCSRAIRSSGCPRSRRDAHEPEHGVRAPDPGDAAARPRLGRVRDDDGDALGHVPVVRRHAGVVRLRPRHHAGDDGHDRALGPDEQPSAAQVSVATHYAHNVARGAAILADKWNRAPELRPVAGTDTNGSPATIENWYYAVWSYNGFTGPGDRMSNHPADPGFSSWPRPAYRCDGKQARNRYPYQELVWGCMASPPSVSGQQLWDAVPATLPDLTDPRYFQALSPGTFAFPYAAMDFPTPQPAHEAAVPSLPANYRARTLGAPALSASSRTIILRTDGPPTAARATIEVRNSGSGILSWVALPSDGWLSVDPPAGVALGAQVPCTDACTRAAKLTITVNPTLLPAASATGTLRITSPNGTGRPVSIRVEVEADFEVGAPGTSRAY